MNCFRCGAELKEKNAAMTAAYAGKEYSVKTKAMVCSECGYKTLRADQFDAFRTATADVYRADQGLLTSAQIRELRSRLGMSQNQFADYLGVGIASIKRWELGKAQEPSNDELIRLKTSLSRAEQNVLDVLRQQGGEADEYSGDRSFDFGKLANVVLFFLQTAANERKKLGPLHINKLCWYADADNYRRNAVSIAGTRYARLPLGPAPDDYVLIFRELQRSGVVEAKGTAQLIALRYYDEGEFSPEELTSLRRVWNRFRNKLSSLVDESHQERAWKQTPHAQLISFKLVK